MQKSREIVDFTAFLIISLLQNRCAIKTRAAKQKGKNEPGTQTASRFKLGGPGGIRTLDLSDANRTLSRTRHNASTEHVEENGCVSFKTGTGCVLFGIFHRTVRSPAPILSKQELSINPSLCQPSEKYIANRRKSLGTSENTTHSDERSESEGAR